MTDIHQEKTFKDILRVIFSHYKLFIIASAVFTIAAMTFSHCIPVRYTTMAMFERRGDSATDAVANNNKNESFEILKLTLEQELIGPKAVEKVATDLGLFKDLPRSVGGDLTAEGLDAKNKIIRDIIGGLAIEWKVRSAPMDLVALRFSYPDPDIAVQVPNSLVKNYINNAGEEIISRLRNSREFLRKQVDLSNVRLNELTRAKIEFEAKYGEMLIDGSGNIQERIQDTYAGLDALYRQRDLAQQRYDQVKALIRSAQSQKLQDQLTQLRTELDKCIMVNQMTDEHPEVQKLLARIAQTRKQLKKQQEEAQSALDDASNMTSVDSGLLLQLTAARSDLSACDTEIDRLKRRIAGFQSFTSKSAPLREQYLRITKPVEDQQLETNRWQQRLTDVQMTLAAEEAKRRTQLSTVLLAQKPQTPRFPPLWTVIGLSVAGGLAFGYGLTFLVHTLDHSIKTPKEAAETIDIPVLGVISEIITRRERSIRRVTHSLLALAVTVILLATLGFTAFSVVLRLEYPDQFRQFRASLPRFAWHQAAPTQGKAVGSGLL